jgi:hypothetical protein
MVSCSESWAIKNLPSQTALPRRGDAGEGVSDECIAVAARPTRRDGIAAWRWRYPGSPCAQAMT